MRKLNLFLVSFLLLSGLGISAQQTPIWEAVDEEAKHTTSTVPHKTHKYRLHIDALDKQLRQAQNKTQAANTSTSVIIHFPMPDGSRQAFEVYETSIMAPALASRYPNIRSFTGHAIENPLIRIKFTLTNFGFHGMIFHPEGTTSYINPEHQQAHIYTLFSKKDRIRAAKAFACQVQEEAEIQISKPKKAVSHNKNQPAIANDGNLRVFRLALASTAEYTAFHANAAGVGSGTDEEKKAATLAAMNVTMTRVNGIFERDLGLTMELVPNESIIFLNANTDGLSNDSGLDLINEIQSVVDANIGAANYDIGHVFSTGGGGIAQLNSPCTFSKARGVTGLPNPVGDPFDVDYVAHEMGHQYGATHTFNNSCAGNRADITAVEPGSGSTIMSYAGICPPNIQNNVNAYFHTVSIQQMWENISSGNSTCAHLSPTGNTAPTANAGNDYTIPVSTPFVLEGEGTDADGDMLTYCWEQTDPQITTQPPLSNASAGPLFRSRSPNSAPNRYFPAPASIRSGIAMAWEVLPTVSRTLHFSLLVRDNNANGGQTARDDMQIIVENNSGPFVLTSQETEEVWEAGSVQTISWQVAGTNIAPISAPYVSIFLYTDPQFENPILLAEHVLNDGQQDIIVPGGITTTTARVMVRPVNNIFFAMNTSDITIAQSEYTLNFNNLEQIGCQPDDTVFHFTYNSYLGFSDETNFTAIDVPAGLNISFNPSSTTDDNTDVEVRITNTDGIAEGNYTFSIRAASGPIIKVYDIALGLYNPDFDLLSLTSPSNTATGINLSAPLIWQADDFAQQYEVEISDHVDFSSIIESAIVFQARYIPQNLQSDRTYYWRVKPINDCGEGVFSTAFSYTTKFSLPPENFIININGESCISNNDGQISIMAEETFNYEATLTGPEMNMSTHFTEEASFLNISAGSYTLCITVDGISDYEQCYTLMITEPDPLSVQSKVDPSQKTVVVDMEGGALYNVALNGIITQTTDKTITLTLKEGVNTLKVTTDKSCQGIYEEEIIIGNRILVYPNPTKGETIYLNTIGNSGKSITVKIYSILGKLHYNKIHIEEESAIPISLSGIPSGLYLIKIQGESIKATQKIIKL